MAYEGPPYICYETFANHISYNLTFVPDMIVATTPPGDRWHPSCAAIVFTYDQLRWLGTHTLRVGFFITAPIAGQDVYLGYSPLHPNLLTQYGTDYPAWDPILAPPC